MSLALNRISSTRYVAALPPRELGGTCARLSVAQAFDEVGRSVADAIEHSIERLAPRPGERLLDVGTGCGWAARRLAERQAKVSAIDPARSAIAAAEALAKSRSLEIAFAKGEAEALPYPDAAFDGVVSAFGVTFAQRPQDAAAELARVCRPGGRLTLTAWTPDGNVFGMFRVMKPYMAAPDDAPSASPFDWGRPERVSQLLGEAFELSFEKGTSVYRAPSGEAAWRSHSRGYAPLRALLGHLGEVARARLKRDFIAFHDSFAGGLGISVPRDYWLVVGKRR